MHFFVALSSFKASLFFINSLEKTPSIPLKKILWKYAPHKDGRCDIKIYVYQKGKQRHYSTGLAVLPKKWDERSGSVKKSHPNHKTYNTRIQKSYLELDEHFFSGVTFDDFGQEDHQVSLKITKQLMNMGLEEKPHTNLARRDPAFKHPRMKASSKIYLTIDEIDQLEQLYLSSQPNMERERDRFLLAYWFVMLFSDVCRVKRE